uniref:Enoyl-CoA hydratase n=2 Tax=Candidatus Bipolaricaulota TaxID=67810 RepID=H5SH50_9BACT|nr:enoyl-CoA hydratase [uncultured Acetothermia bacterium]BAL60224.1 enoyl-CoA hydratase [Candidatus Acetothermum autotrophicum]
MNYQTIRYEVAEGVATITLNRPDVLNAANLQMLRELNQALDAVQADAGVRAAVLTGAGRAFCAGADLAGMGEGFDLTDPLTVRRWLVEFFNPLILKIFEMEKPWIAAVNGIAAGGGCQLALACDLVVIAEDAYFCEIFAQRGLVVDLGGLFLLPRLVGLHKAKELAFFAEKISGLHAVELGLANTCVPGSELRAVAHEWATKLAQGPTVALGLMKVGMNRGLQMTLRDVMQYEASAQALAVHTQDVQEGLRAFVEKRAPKFQGR